MSIRTAARLWNLTNNAFIGLNIAGASVSLIALGATGDPFYIIGAVGNGVMGFILNRLEH